MFLKIILKDQVKKLSFSPELRNYQSLLNLIIDITKQNKDNIDLVFIDFEGDKITICDEFDMDYFIKTFEGNDFAELKINEKKLNEVYQGFIDVNLTNNNLEVKKSFTEITNSELELKEKEIDFLKQEKENTLLLKSSENILTNVKESFVQTENDFNIISNDLNNQDISRISQPIDNLHIKNNETLRDLDSFNFEELENKVNFLMQNFNKSSFVKNNSNSSDKKLKIINNFIQSLKLESSINEELNFNTITCNYCKKKIENLRFKCLICHDYDLCGECNKNKVHSHEMIQSVTNDLLIWMDQRLSQDLRRKIFFDSKEVYNYFYKKILNDIEKRLNGIIKETKIINGLILSEEFEEKDDKNKKDKIQLIKFMLGITDEKIIEEYIQPYEHLELLEFAEKIKERYFISDNK